MSSPEMLMKYPLGHASALIPVVFFAILSGVAVVFVLLRFSWFSARALVFKRLVLSHDLIQERAFFQTQLGAYTSALLFSNLLGSIAFTINIRWIEERAVMADPFCVSQGILNQISELANAYFSGIIAIHSFHTLVLRNRLPIWVSATIIVFGWLFSALIGVLPSVLANGSTNAIYGHNGLFCGITEDFFTAQVILRILPICLSFVVSVVFYILIYLIVRGTLVIDDGVRLNLNRESVVDARGDSSKYRDFVATVVKSMIWYPIAYIGLVLWSMISLLISVSGGTVPFAFNVFASSCAAMLGLANALVVLNTLRLLVPLLIGPTEKKEVTDAESFVTGTQSLAPTPVTLQNPYKAKTAKDKTLPPLPSSAGYSKSPSLSEKELPFSTPPTPPSKPLYRGTHAPSDSQATLVEPTGYILPGSLKVKLDDEDVCKTPMPHGIDMIPPPHRKRPSVVCAQTKPSVLSPVADAPFTAGALSTATPMDDSSVIVAYFEPHQLPEPWHTDSASCQGFASFHTDAAQSPHTASAVNFPNTHLGDHTIRQRPVERGMPTPTEPLRTEAVRHVSPWPADMPSPRMGSPRRSRAIGTVPVGPRPLPSTALTFGSASSDSPRSPQLATRPRNVH